ncbi:Protein of unknown function [Gryllus bimaculatus]|nr:Protein of unknown function [Gryllus bimaculatus]
MRFLIAEQFNALAGGVIQVSDAMCVMLLLLPLLLPPLQLLGINGAVLPTQQR